MRLPDVTTPPGAGAALAQRVAVSTDGTRNYKRRTLLRNHCRYCGQLTRHATCRTCRAWRRVYHAHVAMTAALRGAMP